MANKIEEIDLETAQMIVQKAEEKRMQEFAKEYEELCKKYGFMLAPSVQLGIKKL
jgi:thiamine monophosphate synthase